MGPIRIVGLVCIALVAISLYYSWGVWDVGIKSAAITGVTDIDADGFTLAGTLSLQNPSRISVRIEKATFKSTLEMTGEEIGTGEITDVLVPPGMTEAPFTQRIKWEPLTDAAQQIILAPNAYVRVDGEAQILILDTISMRTPIIARSDMRSLILSRLESVMPEKLLNSSMAVGEDLLNAALDALI